jgi:peptide/nickel transport system permease protein
MAIAEAGLSKISTEQAGQWKLVWQRFRQHRRGRIALFVFLLLVLLLLIGPLFVPFDHNFVDLPTTWAAVPGTVGDGGRVHYLGTDAVGRDELARLLIGGQATLVIAVVSALLTTIIGLVIGALAGFYGGWVDANLMRFSDLLLSVPILPLYLFALPAVHRSLNAPHVNLGRSGRPSADYEPAIYILGTIIIVFTIFGWMGISRLVRASILSARAQPYVEASRALGISNIRLIWKHLIPNSLAPVLVAATFAVADFIAWEAILAYLTLGIDQAFFPTWGNLIATSQGYVFRLAMLDLNPFHDIRLFLAIFPAALIFVSILSLNFIAEAMRDALDPATRI